MNLNDYKKYADEYAMPKNWFKEENEFIVWGISKYAENIKRRINDANKKLVCYWDRKVSIPVDGISVNYPDIKGQTEYTKNNTVIVLAHTTDNNISECYNDLLSNGYQKIMIAKDYFKILKAHKIMNDYENYKNLNTRDTFKITNDDLWIFDEEWLLNAGASFKEDYFQQDLWAAKKIYKDMPKKHYDIGSRIDGFITHLLSFEQDVVLIDIRPYDIGNLENLSFLQSNATELKEIESNSLDSLSALCSLEHFGLGRYGDPIDPDACFKAFKNVQRVMKKGGHVYISVPVGRKEFLAFNAHRVFLPKTVVDEFNEMNLVEFACTSNKGVVRFMDPFTDPDKLFASIEYYSYSYIGLFHFQKK